MVLEDPWGFGAAPPTAFGIEERYPGFGERLRMRLLDGQKDYLDGMSPEARLEYEAGNDVRYPRDVGRQPVNSAQIAEQLIAGRGDPWEVQLARQGASPAPQPGRGVPMLPPAGGTTAARFSLDERIAQAAQMRNVAPPVVVAADPAQRVTFAAATPTGPAQRVSFFNQPALAPSDAAFPDFAGAQPPGQLELESPAARVSSAPADVAVANQQAAASRQSSMAMGQGLNPAPNAPSTQPPLDAPPPGVSGAGQVDVPAAVAEAVDTLQAPLTAADADAANASSPGRGQAPRRLRLRRPAGADVISGAAEVLDMPLTSADVDAASATGNRPRRPGPSDMQIRRREAMARRAAAAPPPPPSPPDGPPPGNTSRAPRAPRGTPTTPGLGFMGDEWPSFDPLQGLRNREAAAREFAANATSHAERARGLRAAGRYAGTIKTLGLLGRGLGVAGLVAAPIAAAADGASRAGVGGAVIQGGSSLGGALGGAAIGAGIGSVVPVIGTGIGAAVGGIIGGVGGDWAGRSLTGGAQYAVDKAQQGDAGFLGSVGRMLDPLIETPYEQEQAQLLRDLNSPARQLVMSEQRLADLRASNEASRQILLQMAARGYGTM